MLGSYVFQEGTVITPTEMDMLYRVFQRLCDHRHIPSTGPRAEIEAAHLVALFSDGLNTEELLWQVVAEDV
jgi:helix-turn-helix protein